MNEFTIIEHMSFNWMITTYFFLCTMSAGIYFFSIAADRQNGELDPVFLKASILKPVMLAAGMLLLLADLGRPLAAWRLITFNPTSAISWGFWLISIFLLLSIAYAWYMWTGKQKKAKTIAYWTLPFGILTILYTGMVLAQAPGRALWHTALLPWLFVVGGLVSGLAAVILASANPHRTALSKKLGGLIAGLIVLELVMLTVKMLVLFNGGPEAVAAAKHILAGPFSTLFWTVTILLGALVPALLFSLAKENEKAQVTASLLAIVGFYALMYIVVVGGQVPTY